MPEADPIEKILWIAFPPMQKRLSERNIFGSFESDATSLHIDDNYRSAVHETHLLFSVLWSFIAFRLYTDLAQPLFCFSILHGLPFSLFPCCFLLFCQCLSLPILVLLPTSLLICLCNPKDETTVSQFKVLKWIHACCLQNAEGTSLCHIQYWWQKPFSERRLNNLCP